MPDEDESVLENQDVTGVPSVDGHGPEDLSDEADEKAVLFDDGKDISEGEGHERERPEGGQVPVAPVDHGGES